LVDSANLVERGPVYYWYFWEDNTAPTVDSVSPTNGATDIALDSNVTATFADLAINADTVTNESFALTKDGSAVAAHVSYDFNGEGLEEATLDPDSVLEENTTYTATITTSVKDLVGHALGQDYSWTFTTTDDTTVPSTTPALSPQPNAAGWNKESVTLTLSATDDDSGVKEITYSSTGGQQIASTTVQQSSVQIPITAEGETTISYHATDKVGNDEPEHTFKVKLDKSAPTLDTTNADSVEPDNKQTRVRPDIETITATFSDEMNPASLTTSTAKLYQWNAKKKKWQSVPVAASVVDNKVTLDPYGATEPTGTETPLAANKRFKLTFTTGAKNLAGIPLSSSNSWTFTTEK
jgi:hypothetical protein